MDYRRKEILIVDDIMGSSYSIRFLLSFVYLPTRCFMTHI